MIPHKSRAYRAILDLAYAILFKEGRIPAVNETTVKCAPKGSMDQMGHALQHIIYAYATAAEDDIIFATKQDIKDGFWRLVAEEGGEWNFAYVLPSEEGKSTQLVVPTLLQMGWTESPLFFNVASETACHVGEDYAQAPIGLLHTHKFHQFTSTMPEY